MFHLCTLCRELRQHDASKFHAQLCIAMFGMLLFFLVGIDRTETEAGCTIMSLFIQYFTLASMGWMGAEAVLMFQAEAYHCVWEDHCEIPCSCLPHLLA